MAVSNEINREPAARFVILGASNVARGVSTIVESACLCSPARPLEIFGAFGHGRSFGLTSRVLGRTLPGIMQCRLWEQLRCRTSQLPLPLTALVTDIGNDILYGVEPRIISSWVERCLVMLIERGAAVALTRLPMQSIQSLRETRFVIARRLLFPRSALDLQSAVELATELDERIAVVARTLRVTLIEHEQRWYGLDPIHIRIRHWREAWPAIVGAAGGLGMAHAQADTGPLANTKFIRPRFSPWRWLRLKLMAPDIRWMCGMEQRRRQPGLILADGTSVWSY